VQRFEFSYRETVARTTRSAPRPTTLPTGKTSRFVHDVFFSEHRSPVRTRQTRSGSPKRHVRRFEFSYRETVARTTRRAPRPTTLPTGKTFRFVRDVFFPNIAAPCGPAKPGREVPNDTFDVSSSVIAKPWHGQHAAPLALPHCRPGKHSGLFTTFQLLDVFFPNIGDGFPTGSEYSRRVHHFMPLLDTPYLLCHFLRYRLDNFRKYSSW